MVKNIEVFDQYVGIIFARLYAEFPIPQELDYCFLPEECVSEADSEPEIVGNTEIWLSTIKWLEFAGFIHIERESSMSALEVVLTPKALEVMKSVPSSIETNNQNIGDFLIQNSKEGVGSAIKTGVAYALSMGVQLI